MIRRTILFCAACFSAIAQPQLQRQIRDIAAQALGRVSVSCALPDSALNCDLDPHAHPPMQSVFKVPLALTVLHFIEQGKWTIAESVRFQAADRILPHTVSPLQDRYPEGNVDVPIGELLRLAVVESDNVAADILLRTVGGPEPVNRYLASLGISGFHLQDDEAAVHRNPALQYRNWFEPAAAVQLLRRLADRSPLTPQHTAELFDWMRDTPKGPARIKGRLPAGTLVMHKPGSWDTPGRPTAAWNDIGLIQLPGGRRLAIAVFVTDSTADETTRDVVIARIAEAAFASALKAGK